MGNSPLAKLKVQNCHLLKEIAIKPYNFFFFRFNEVDMRFILYEFTLIKGS